MNPSFLYKGESSMKKIQIMAAVLLILFVLSACSSRSENPAQAASVSPEPTGSSQAEPQPDDPPEELSLIHI